MSFNLSAWSIKRPVPTLVLFLILSFVGFNSFKSLGIDANPNIDIPAVSITVTQPGAGPTELESQVTKKIEDAVAGLGNIDQLTSKVSDGNSTTTINFVLGTNSDRATNDVRNAVAQIRQTLPADINDPIVKRLEFAGGSIMTYAVTSTQRSPEELSDIVDRQISRALLAVPGVAQVQRAGGFDREISVELNPDRLQALGITATQVNDQIRAFNINLPGGRTDAGGRQQTIRTLGSAESVETLKEYRIVLPNNSAVPLGSIAEVKDDRSEALQISRFILGKGSQETTDNSQLQAKEVVAFSVFRSTGSTLVTVEEGVRKAVENLKKSLPEDIKLELIITRATNIRESYEASTDALWEASWMAMLTILFFLRDWRATVIAAIALPLSILPTYWVMQLLGYTLNGMTLLALALTVGNLVDDSVVEIENMDQHLAMGKKPRQAALDSSEEIGLAALSGCATIVAVFMPVAFMGGVPGQFFQPFGVTVAVSTLFSTFVARTMTPMLCAVLMKPKKEGGGFRLPFLKENPFKNIHPYRSLLSWCLRHRVTTILISIAFFIGSLQLVPLIPKGLFSNGDVGVSSISLELPPGATLADTDKVVQQTIEVLRQNSVVKNVLATTGGSGGNANNTASIFVNLTPREERAISQQDFEKKMREEFKNIPGARISFAGSGAAGSRKDLTILLTSENPVALSQASDGLERQMREIDGLVEVSSSASLVKPEILIKPDPARAADLGVTVNAIARTASLATIGDNEASLAKFDLPDRQIPIRVKLADKFRDDLQAIRNLQIPSSRNTLVPLSAVAEITLGSGPATIDRYDRSRQVIVDGNLQGSSLGQALEKVKALPALKNLPADVKERSEGDAKIMQDIFSRFIGALGLAVLCIYAILVLLYNSFLIPFTILVSLPLSIGGALIALLATQTELGLFALIGIVLLMGLVTKNAIILVDCALANQEEGMPQFKALIESGVSRLRPIMMTSISTIAGMIPIAMGLGAGSQTRAPMAVAVIGGFTTSTLLTLVVVPVLYTYVDNFQRWLLGLPKSSRWRWLRGWGKRSLLVRFYKPKIQ